MNLNNASKAKYINTDGKHDLLIADCGQKVKNGTTIVSMKCKNENDEIYRKEFSLSEEGVGYFVAFLDEAELLTQEQRSDFKADMLLGLMFTTEFGKKKNAKYDPNNEKSKPYYVYELPNKITPYEK